MYVYITGLMRFTWCQTHAEYLVQHRNVSNFKIVWTC